MIFFGTRGKTVTGQQVTGPQCPNCGNGVFTSFGVQRYFHLYWIPTFPTKKHVGVECTNCKHAMIDDQIPGMMIDDIRSSVFSTASTLPMFSGLAIIAVLVGFVFYAGERDRQQETAYLDHPAINDYYVVDYTRIFEDVDPDYKYGVMQISAIDGDEITFRLSNYSYNLASGVRDDIRKGTAAKDDYYAQDAIWFDADSLAEMQKDGTIKSIERK